MKDTLHAEWTKLRTLRGWLLTLAAAAAAMLAFGLLPGLQGSCGQHGPGSECVSPVGPEGHQVSDSFTFVHRELTGDGELSAHVADFTGLVPDAGTGDEPPQDKPGLAPWAKAGILLKDGTTPGSAYAAVMVTGANGVRLQHNYVHDQAGTPGHGPRWLRLTRAADTVTAWESADGTTFTTVGTVTLPGLPATVRIGLFVTSPQHAEEFDSGLGTTGAMGGPTRATAVFDHVDDPKTLTVQHIGGSPNGPGIPETLQDGDTFTVTGSGDIAPAVAGAAGAGVSITQTLAGTFVSLILVVVLGAGYASGEYRRGMIRLTLAATPRRGRVLAAKAAVLAAATFVPSLIAAAVVVVFGQKVLRDNGAHVLHADTGLQLRVIAGTAALLAVCAVLALGLGALLRRSTLAVTAAIVTIVLPYLLAMTVLPTPAGQWLLRLTPAAAFALQQSAVQYPQVANLYTPVNGYFPLSPWAGLAVLAVWAVTVLSLAWYRLKGKDA